MNAKATGSKGSKGGKAQQQSLSIFHLPTDLLSSLVLPSQLNRRIRTSQPAKASSSSSDIVDGRLSHRLAQAARVATPQCSVCGGIEFDSGEEQRRHFKTATHEANLVRRLVWRRNHPDAVAEPGEYPWEPVKAEDDEQGSDENESAWSESDVSVVDDSVASAENSEMVVMLGNHGRATMDAEALVEEIEAGQKYGRRGGAAEVAAYGGSGDDSSSEGEGEDEGARRDRGSSPWLWFASEAGVGGDSPMVTVYGVQRRILIPRGQHGVHTSSDQILHDLRKMQLPVAPKQSQQELKSQGHSPKLSAESSVWVILATNGGYFAGAVFDNRTGQVVAHKTFQRYTTRRKQGGSQARQDNAMGRLANSAGAQIRRYNEQKLQEEIRDLMSQWHEYLQRSECVFVRVARTQRKGFFAPPSSADNSATQPIRWSDPRVRSVPVPMARPSLAELLRVYRELTTVRIKAVRRAEVRGPGSSKDVDDDEGGGGTQESQRASAAENNDDAGSESDHTLDAEPRPDLLAFLHHVAKMVVNQEKSWADQQIVDYLDKNMRQLLDALSDPAIGLRYLQDTDLIQAHRTPTLLHLASATGRTELVPYLMDHGEDPTVTNGHPPLFSNGKTAYEVAKDEKTKDAFLAYRLENAGDADNAIEWNRSGMPDQELDAEQREQQQRDLEREARTREKKRRDRERKRAKEKARKQQKAQEDAEKADDQALEQAQKNAGKQQEQLASLSQSELRARMLSMAYASAGRSWGGGPVRDAKKKPEPVAQRPVSPGTQRARDRELRFQAAERRRQQQQQQQQNQGAGAGRATTGECTHCGRPLHGLVPFEQFDWRCCSIKCLQDHRLQPH